MRTSKSRSSEPQQQPSLTRRVGKARTKAAVEQGPPELTPEARYRKAARDHFAQNPNAAFLNWKIEGRALHAMAKRNRGMGRVSDNALWSMLDEYERIFVRDEGWRQLEPLGRNLSPGNRFVILQFIDRMKNEELQKKPRKSFACKLCGWVHPPDSFEQMSNPLTGFAYVFRGVNPPKHLKMLHKALEDGLPGVMNADLWNHTHPNSQVRDIYDDWRGKDQIAFVALIQRKAAGKRGLFALKRLEGAV